MKMLNIWPRFIMTQKNHIGINRNSFLLLHRGYGPFNSIKEEELSSISNLFTEMNQTDKNGAILSLISFLIVHLFPIVS